MWVTSSKVISNTTLVWTVSKDLLLEIDLSEIETENNFERNKQMIFNNEEKLYNNAANTCHVCGHCHETGKYREPACKLFNLRYKQQNFFPIIFHNGSGYVFNLLYSELFKQNND